MLIVLIISIMILLTVFLFKLPSLYVEEEFYYDYLAKSNGNKDHKYKFLVKWVDDGYRCYIEKTPSFVGRDTSHYMPHYWEENGTGRHYICWTGKIQYSEQAKTLCRNWADATQQFIDTGKPAKGFER